MRLPLLYLMLLIIGSCSQKDSEKELKPYFSESEIRDLNLIADFFQNEFCGTTDRTKFGNCLTNALPKLVDWEHKYLRKKISWRKQKKLYSKISDSTFNKIWGICKNWLHSEPEYEYESICFSYDKTFIAFVKSLEESNPSMEGYGEKLEAVGTFAQTVHIMEDLSRSPENTDLDNRAVQILLSIHFLTENDLMKRDEKAIRLEKQELRKRELEHGKKTVPNNG